MLLFVIAVSVALIVSFMCSIFESVLLSINRAQIEALVKQEKKAGHLLSAFKRRIDVPIAAILIVNTIAHTIGSAVAGASYEDAFNPDTLWVFAIVFTTAVLLFTEIIPKTLGVTYAVQLATPVAVGIKLLTVTLRPLVWASERMSRALRGNHKVPVTSVEEIRLLASLGRNEGVVGLRTAQVIEGATHLRSLSARDILLPRHKVVFLSGSHSRADALKILRESGHSRFPYTPTGDLDDASHVVLAKQLMSWMFAHPGKEIAWDEVTREPIVVPEAMPAATLLKTFKEARRHLAIVVDEYGSVQGIVTIEDVLEELVGEILDEYDPQLEEITRLADGSFRVAADLDLRRLCRQLEIDWEPEGEVATIAGLLMETLERVPVAGDNIDWRGYRLTVTGADARRILTVLVERLTDSGS